MISDLFAKYDDSFKGAICLVFFDAQTSEVVTLGQLQYKTWTGLERAWARLADFDGVSTFQADFVDSEGEIAREKTVSAEDCEALLGRSISSLIAAGRAALADELARQIQFRHGHLPHGPRASLQ